MTQAAQRGISKHHLFTERADINVEYAATNEAMANVELRCLTLQDQLETALREREHLKARLAHLDSQMAALELKIFKVLAKEFK